MNRYQSMRTHHPKELSSFPHGGLGHSHNIGNIEIEEKLQHFIPEFHDHSKRNFLPRFKNNCHNSQQKQMPQTLNDPGILEKNTSFRKHNSLEKSGETNRNIVSQRRLFERVADGPRKKKLTFPPSQPSDSSERKKSDLMQNGRLETSFIVHDHARPPTCPPRRGLAYHRSQSMVAERPRMHGSEDLYSSFTGRLKQGDRRFRRLSCPGSVQHGGTNIENIRYQDNAEQHRSSSLAGQDDDRLVPGRYPPKLEGMIINKMKIIALKKSDEGNFEYSHDIFQNVLEVQKVSLGKFHPEVANTSCHLGHVLICMNQLKAAKSTLESAYFILSSRAPSADLIRVLKGLAQVSEKSGEIDSAINLLHKVQSIERSICK